MDNDNHSIFTVEELNIRTELKMGKWHKVEPFIGIRGVALVARGSYEVSLLSRPCPAYIISSTQTNSG